MSLDVYLTVKEPVAKKGTGVFIRDNGQTRELTQEEVSERFPGSEVAVQQYESDTVYSANITHNLGAMAKEAGIYRHLWRPEEIGITKAKELIEPLETGVALLHSDADRFSAFDSPNGWGLYVHFVPWVEAYLEMCKQYPEAEVRVSR